MATTLILIELLVVLVFIFIGARVGGVGLGIYGMLGTFILVYVFGLAPGKAPIDVMLIILAVITASAALQATGGLEYLVGRAALFLRRHPDHITYYGPLCCLPFASLPARHIPATVCCPSSVRSPKPTRHGPSVR